MTQPFVTDYDLHLLGEGRHFRADDKLGAHALTSYGVEGVHFAVVAPNATDVSVVGDFNGWHQSADRLERLSESGVWHRFVPQARHGSLYKYRVQDSNGVALPDKADPFAFAAELRPRTASIVWDLTLYRWQDEAWLENRPTRQTRHAPLSIYEVHLGSWRRTHAGGHRWLTYRELADQLAEYVAAHGFTHIELLPITEHPFDASWGYQTVGYYAPTSRFGTPDDFKAFVDTLHGAGIGVILDWVPAHFPDDDHGLADFDGSGLFEHPDPLQRHHPEWHTRVFDYGRSEVQNFLISNARFWLEHYHVDGLRVDAVASMLYLDYARPAGEWTPNDRGGHENLQAAEFLKTLNGYITDQFPDVLMIAEESTTWPGVSAAADRGGLGFSYKWNMGWMHDIFECVSQDSTDRHRQLEDIGLSLGYAFAEHFVLPFSHDEVVHGKGSLISRMPGDAWQQFANLRLLYGYMFGYPGKKLLFMGNEFGQRAEWNFERSLDWRLTDIPSHHGLQRWVADLNACYRRDTRLHYWDTDERGFSWVADTGATSAVLSFFRHGPAAKRPLLFVCNFTPFDRREFRVGVPERGLWPELLNSDAECYGGRGLGNFGSVLADPIPAHGHAHSLSLTVPALGVLLLG